MNRRKPWWAVGIFNYSFKVQLFYYLAIFCIVLAVPVVRKTQFIPLQFNSMLLASVAFIVACITFFGLFAIKAKKEYEENGLG